MSTYLYLVCKSHKPYLRSDGESGQHLYDLPQIRRDIANRDALVQAAKADDGLDRGHWFLNSTLRFLTQHPLCDMGIRDEYGDWHALEADAEVRCGASITLRNDDHELAECRHPSRHPGPHEDGRGTSWTDGSTR